MRYKIIECNYTISQVNRNTWKWCSILVTDFLLSNFLEVVCCDVIHVLFHFVGGKLLFHRAQFSLLYVQ